MKHKSKILSALEDAYKANKGIAVTDIEDCRRKVVVNNVLEYVYGLISKESEGAEETKSVEKEEADDESTGERGQAVSE